MLKMKSLAAAAVMATVLGVCGQAVVRAEDVVTDGEVLQTASFIGENDHVVSGEVQLVQNGEVLYIVLGEDFSFDGAPDPRLGFSANDEFDEASTFSGLNLDSGKQVYRLPATLDVSQFDELTILCEKFSVPLAEAKF